MVTVGVQFLFLKAIGFTPREVTRAYVAQALIPAAASTALGVVLGNLLAVPLLSDTESVYGGVSLSGDLVGGCRRTGRCLGRRGDRGADPHTTGLIPALRDGRLRTVEAIAVGRAPRTGRGQWAHRATGMLPLPVTYGLARPFTHPIRSLAMLSRWRSARSRQRARWVSPRP
ncbi:MULTISPECIES: ABC transporter permease [unclassified Streptomyces]|uniref:FtsX-like permease family protein n=1 Tax=unclassified Streptomyces TaxID=2593676 RepID=UPI001EEFA968|nr:MULTISPECIES: ABC transporter permease [unclassified Streptomyces]